MADSTTVSSSSDVAQPSQPIELPRQSGKHSIVSALAKPAYTFDGSNYGPWRCAFLEFLNAHGLRHHLTDSSPKESDPAYSEWSRLDSAVCSWLISSVATQIMEPLSMTRPARALWLKLEMMYVTSHFCASLKHKDDGKKKFIKPNSQRQDIIIKYWVSIGLIHREQG